MATYQRIYYTVHSYSAQSERNKRQRKKNEKENKNAAATTKRTLFEQKDGIKLSVNAEENA